MFCISRRVRDGAKSLHRSPLLLTVTHRFTWPIFFLPGAGFWGIFSRQRLDTQYQQAKY
jgi:hypothetical protein